MGELLTTEALSALLQVILMDPVLVGDNAFDRPRGGWPAQETAQQGDPNWHHRGITAADVKVAEW
jgi:hypothetical protein